MKPNYKKSEQEALRLLYEFNYKEPPVDPIDIAKQMGIHVKMVTFDRNDVSGMYNYEQRTIYVNNNEIPTRKLFTVAHELGHAIMHDEYVRSKDYKILLRSSYDKDLVECEADAFAANLMMPRFMIDKLKGLTTKEELAKIFAVSMSAINNRIGFFKRFSKTYEQW
jgi:Zn-dependent peptidase ImmA (M78 family)